jgi:serine/threonine protein kinase
MAKDLVGKTLGQYELVEIAGEGGLATVYKAYQHTLERWVAVKVLHVRDREMLARFKREARAVALLRHRNILMVYQYSEDDGWPYIAMEYVEGGTLEDYLQGEPMDWADVVNMTLGIADALREAHQHGLIHRDVKPANIMLPQRDWPLLTDFGLVKIPDEVSITMTGVVIGTPAYIAPELALGKKANHRADIYSLGVVMFEMITGRWPFMFDNPNLLMLAHISEAVPAPRELNPACPPNLEKVILKCLEKSPDDRYPDMQTMIDALSKILGESTLPFSAAGVPHEQGSADMPPRPTKGLRTSTKGMPKPPQRRSQAAQILLSDENITLTVPEPPPGQNGLVIGRTHGQTKVDIDLGPYGAAKAGISRQHARLNKIDSTWQIDDLGSMNGTYVNDKKVKPGKPKSLKSGDVIRCSMLSFVFLTPNGES